MNKIKSEMEDLSLRYLKPDTYFDILEKEALKNTWQSKAKAIIELLEKYEKKDK